MSGTAGASAQREHDRRHAAREQRVLGSHPRIGKLLLALSSDPQSTTAWAKGADGERTLGHKLDECAGTSVIVLQDLRVPGSRANIDHIVVTPSHVFVIDAKEYSGEIRTRNYGSLLRPDVRLTVAGRDRSDLVQGSLHQTERVGQSLADVSPAPQVVPVLCFVHGDWPLLGGPLTIDGVVIMWPRVLASLVRADSDGAASHATATARAIGEVFHPA